MPVTFNGMRSKDVDVFLGNWMPMQTADRKPFLDDHSVEVVRVNLADARYTLAVPAYLYDQGLKDFPSIQKFAGPLGHKIYGIESGNDGNRLVLGMIRAQHVRPRRLPADREQRAGHARRGRARGAREARRSSSSAGSRIR